MGFHLLSSAVDFDPGAAYERAIESLRFSFRPPAECGEGRAAVDRVAMRFPNRLSMLSIPKPALRQRTEQDTPSLAAFGRIIPLLIGVGYVRERLSSTNPLGSFLG